MSELTPEITGRFNYISFRKGLYSVLFLPYSSTVAITIARNLTYEEMKSLRDTLNKTLDAIREDFFVDDDPKENDRRDNAEETA